MDTPEKNYPIVMVRDGLEGIPDFPLPPGYAFRWYQPGDEALWLEVQSAAERFIDITLELYRGEFGTDPVALGQRQVFLMDEQSKAVGTASAWYDDKRESLECGRVHWVAIVPRAQGLGLAKPLLSVVCLRLRELGYKRAFLATSSARVPALNLYCLFGFRTRIQNDAEQAIWDAVKPRLKHA